jgi:hypothetical protein
MRSILLSLALILPAAELPQYEAVTVTGTIKMGYQLVVADLNGDGKPDLIAVDERGTELAWYENPSWHRHVIAADVPRTINVDAYDYDGDGIPEIAIGYHFETDPAKGRPGRQALEPPHPRSRRYGRRRLQDCRFYR